MVVAGEHCILLQSDVPQAVDWFDLASDWSKRLHFDWLDVTPVWDHGLEPNPLRTDLFLL